MEDDKNTFPQLFAPATGHNPTRVTFNTVLLCFIYLCDCLFEKKKLPHLIPSRLNCHPMARQKQTAPLQRATSSELIHMLPDDFKANGKEQAKQNGSIQAFGNASRDAAPEPPGLMQLAICVLGIYASLYVLPSSWSKFDDSS